MNFWTYAFVALIFAGVAAGKLTDPGYAFGDSLVLSGAPVTTLHNPATP